MEAYYIKNGMTSGLPRAPQPPPVIDDAAMIDANSTLSNALRERFDFDAISHAVAYTSATTEGA